MTIQELNKVRDRRRKEIAGRWGEPSSVQHEFMVCCSTGCISIKSREVYQALADKIIESKMQKKCRVTYRGCFGLCAEGPIVMVYPEGTFYIKVDENAARNIFDKTIAGEIEQANLYRNKDGSLASTRDEMDFFKKQKMVVRKNWDYIDPENIEDYIAVDGYQAIYKCLSTMTPESVIQEIKDSKLRGRGGAGFSTGTKWEFARTENNKEKYVICNADEGDPGAFMDRSIIEGNPHGVIEAMEIAGFAIGASKGIIYVRTEYALARYVLEKTIKEAKQRGLLGKNILGTNFSFDITVKQGAGAFVCGEETALIASVEGKRGEPVARPPYPAVRGLRQKPTIINNVETLANITDIILHGAKHFASLGTEKSKGTKVFSLSGNIKNTGLIELPMGITINEIIEDVGGGIPNGKKFKAIQMGGPSGGCIDIKNGKVPIEYDTLSALGSMMGSGGMVVVDEDTCMVNLAKYFLSFTCDESCGKCTPCRIGTKRMLEILQRITEGKGSMEEFEELQELALYTQNNSLCGLGQSAPNPILSTIKNYKEEYIQHIVNKKCPAGECTQLVKFEIIPEKCVGCSVCARNCPTNAISGEPRKTYVIDQSKCIKCGQCKKVCRFGAVDCIR